MREHPSGYSGMFKIASILLSSGFKPSLVTTLPIYSTELTLNWIFSLFNLTPTFLARSSTARRMVSCFSSFGAAMMMFRADKSYFCLLGSYRIFFN